MKNNLYISYPYNHLNYKRYYPNYRPHLQRYSNPLNIQTKNINFENEYIIERLRIPILKGIKDKNIQDNINNSISSDILEFKNQMEVAAKEEYEKAKEEGRPFDPIIISNIYELTYNKNNIISLSIVYHEYINGNDSYIRTTYNYNIKTGRSLSLNDLFKEGVDYISLINNVIRRYLLANPTRYFPETIEEFKGIAPDQPFFLENGYIGLFFGFHEVAPTEAKLPIIKIPLSEFRGYLKPYLLA
ncbi:DUF3298 and DUF4163 domain-containing protein [Thermohalobacter berrensis]|uniref:Uncharacterized protein n=1 Tax=Thermohalobacter berrensis TaxID=99594 RepID=A0A419T7J1_9FIRM|nr:DUF3298 and DUF4163 domain-containing protein [Thermohalobacter berrensis]RKD33441.1 hypothetical protein BET03_09315 [Thermohalobacter berrensis]